MKNILVTGSDGFIGREVCRQLTLSGMIPRCFTRNDDVCDREKVRVTVAKSDGVINLAAILPQANIFGLEYETASVNIIGAINVLDAALEAGVPMVQIANGNEGQKNPYAITKQATTELCLARAHHYQQEVNVVRAFHVYGPGQEMSQPYGPSNAPKIIPSFIARALTGEDIQIMGKGSQLIDLVYVEDVARVVVNALFMPYGRKIDAGTGLATSVSFVAKTIIDACNSASKIIHVAGRMGEPPDATVVATQPEWLNPWPYKLTETIDWYRHALARAA